jgi:hypothetical protein
MTRVFNKEEIEILLEIVEEQKQVCEEFNYTRHLQTLDDIYSKLIVLNSKTDDKSI